YCLSDNCLSFLALAENCTRSRRDQVQRTRCGSPGYSILSALTITSEAGVLLRLGCGLKRFVNSVGIRIEQSLHTDEFRVRFLACDLDRCRLRPPELRLFGLSPYHAKVEEYLRIFLRDCDVYRLEGDPGIPGLRHASPHGTGSGYAGGANRP